MKPMGIFPLLLAVVATVAAQSVDELQIPMENDNLFPPDNNFESDTLIDGSGAGAIEQSTDVTTIEPTSPPPLEDVQLQISEDIEPTAVKHDDACPKPCVCHVEGESNDFVVDCSGYGLTEFPTPINPNTTKLNIQNNKLTEITKDVSLLKNLKVLNADNNSILDLASGSISELPELTVLKLANNRLIEYPQDLKNGFLLTKLEELDLGGNDMRTSLNSDIFSHFTSLKKITLPTSTKELVDSLCTTLKTNLVTICTEKCDTQLFECPDAPQELDDELINVTLPGTIALSNIDEDNADLPAAGDAKVDTHKVDTTDASEVTENVELNVTPATIPDLNVDPVSALQDADKVITTEATIAGVELNIPDVNVASGTDVQENADQVASEVTKAKEDTRAASEASAGIAVTTTAAETNAGAEFSLRSAVNKAPEEVSPMSTLVEPKEAESNHKEATVEHKEADVAVGATTSGTKTGGVDKSVIGIIVAGMVLVVAGITIKKNWSSIRNRFSSSPRTANERPGANANGTAPEEVPLQAKSPV